MSPCCSVKILQKTLSFPLLVALKDKTSSKSPLLAVWVSQEVLTLCQWDKKHLDRKWNEKKSNEMRGVGRWNTAGPFWAYVGEVSSDGGANGRGNHTKNMHKHWLQEAAGPGHDVTLLIWALSASIYSTGNASHGIVPALVWSPQCFQQKPIWLWLQPAQFSVPPSWILSGTRVQCAVGSLLSVARPRVLVS